MDSLSIHSLTNCHDYLPGRISATNGLLFTTRLPAPVRVSVLRQNRQARACLWKVILCSLNSVAGQAKHFGRLLQYTILVFDHRGTGNNGTLMGPYSMSAMAGDVIALLDFIGWIKRPQYPYPWTIAWRHDCI
ncbi:hypothetical protein H4582DRAFT_1934309, partial [Lactarius indigo]